MAENSALAIEGGNSGESCDALLVVCVAVWFFERTAVIDVLLNWVRGDGITSPGACDIVDSGGGKSVLVSCVWCTHGS